MPSIDRDGARICYETKGAGSPAVIFAHNILCDRRVFDGVIDKLSASHRTIAVDFRGHGRTPVPERAYGAADLADDLAAVLDAEGISRAAVVGLSMGATVALELALAKPERVSSLALLGATAREDDLATSARNAFLSPLVRCFGVRGPILHKAVTTLFGDSYRAEASPEYARWTQRIAGLSPWAAYCSLRAWRKRRRFVEELSRLSMPTVVVSGEEDVACTPKEGEEVHRLIRGSRFVLIQRAGHTMSAERPAEVAQALSGFLSP
ncbi:MAG: alpha/beta fold hydrolase [Elusimicrobia bacterium]|nr:alpha/beta fold hydrolase [Elusimicrobiota bacterium]